MSIEDVTLFKHTPLARITRTSQPFRLLEIKPSSEASSQIECTLHHANLLTKPKFKALSYVWGDQSLKVPILLDSKRYDVTRNCYGALLRLRELGETIVWIDAICIDQGKNSQEKSSQIPLMNYIYPTAKEVIVWLGHPEEETMPNSTEIESLAISLLEELAVEEVRTFEQFLEIAQRGETPALRWESLKVIYGHSWFSRLWTHQELILSTSVMFVTNYHTLQFDHLRLATQAIHRASDQMTFRQLPAFINELFEDFQGFKDGLEKARIRTVARINRHNPMHLPHERISALNQVIVGSRFKCSEPRDRIYAILGLLDSDIRSRIVVDNELIIEEVYTNFSAALIEATRSLELLTQAGLAQGPSSCPSWVPDWNLDDSKKAKSLRYSKYSASCLTRPNCSINRKNNELTIRGIAMGSILEVVPVENGTIVRDCTHHLTGAKGFHAWKQHFEGYPTGCDPQQAWIRVVTADMDGNMVTSERLSAEILEEYVVNHRINDSTVEERLLMAPKNLAEYDEWKALMLEISFRFNYAVVAASAFRAFFVTETGYMGMGPEVLIAGDKVCVVLGCNVPLLLRKNQDYFTLVGECFVWGLMDGEAMRMTKKEGDWLDTFRLR
jgi:hypothetical protein